MFEIPSNNPLTKFDPISFIFANGALIFSITFFAQLYTSGSNALKTPLIVPIGSVIYEIKNSNAVFTNSKKALKAFGIVSVKKTMIA